MRTTPEFLADMTKERRQTNFAAFVRNVTPQAMKLTIPFGTAESLPRMPVESFEILLNASRRRLSSEPEKDKDEAQEKNKSPEPTLTIPRPDEDELWEEY